MKKIIFIISVCCFMFSCRDYHTYIPKDKMPILKNNDMIYFQNSASSKIDTLRLDITIGWLSDVEGVEYYYQYVSVNYNKLNSKNTFLSYGISTYTASDLNISVEYAPESWYDGYNYKTIDFTINGITYANVYVGYLNTVLSDTIPNKVYFTCRNGIIRYEYKDGRVYELMNK